MRRRSRRIRPDDPAMPDENKEFEIIMGRYEDHLKLEMSGPSYKKEVTVALPTGSKSTYIGLTGENCRLSSIKAEQTGETVGPNDIARIADKTSYTCRMNDGTEKIFLCAGGDKDDCSDKMKDFLNYISGKNATDDFTERLETEVQKARQKEEWRSSYMRWVDLQEEIREEGRQEGRQEGIMEKAKEVFETLLSRGMSQSEAMQISGYRPA